ncbi:hypothetical protein AXF42_Ash001490 [Apostasia shenzhenica]|uniref:Uncharacterized protein n=1 Tax=Apostasia shenzhenica TaxID=1088818 RepID=A0A2I0AAD8_9ASPA|nr:hypothetical protein AXF42_Ash001490 [Apostasia shenzhenica]
MGRRYYHSERVERCSPKDDVVARLDSDDCEVYYAYGVAVVVAERDRQREESQQLNPLPKETQQSNSYMEKVRFFEAHLEEGRFK